MCRLMKGEIESNVWLKHHLYSDFIYVSAAAGEINPETSAYVFINEEQNI